VKQNCGRFRRDEWLSSSLIGILGSTEVSPEFRRGGHPRGHPRGAHRCGSEGGLGDETGGSWAGVRRRTTAACEGGHSYRSLIDFLMLIFELVTATLHACHDVGYTRVIGTSPSLPLVLGFSGSGRIRHRSDEAWRDRCSRRVSGARHGVKSHRPIRRPVIHITDAVQQPSRPNDFGITPAPSPPCYPPPAHS
jgi:hypothetical protein